MPKNPAVPGGQKKVRYSKLKKLNSAVRIAAMLLAALMLAPLPAAAGDTDSGDAGELLVYKAGNSYGNIASGSITLTQPEKRATITHYNLYWGNKDGRIPGYTALKPLSGSGDVLTYNFENTLIPEGTTRIIACAVKGGSETEYASAEVNTDNSFVFGELKYTLGILSDIHIPQNMGDLHVRHFRSALSQIAAVAPGNLGLLTVGDNVDGSNDMPAVVKEQYSNFLKVLGDSEFKDKFYPTIGNHDLFLYNLKKDHDYVAGLFAEYFGHPLDYDVWLNDSLHLVILGDSVGGDNNATITEEQTKWLDGKLSERYGEEGVVTILALHQPLYNTVAGTFPGQGWNGIDESSEPLLRNVLKKYPDAIMVNGHTHWEFDSKGVMTDGGSDLPYIFLVPSCGYLWTDEQKAKTGSQGYVLEVYDNAIRMRGRDFGQDKWAPQADFVIQMKESAKPETSAPATESVPATGTDNPVISNGGSMKTAAFVLAGVAVAAVVTAIAIPGKKKK